jgi:hypothetical protein
MSCISEWKTTIYKNNNSTISSWSLRRIWSLTSNCQEMTTRHVTSPALPRCTVSSPPEHAAHVWLPCSVQKAIVQSLVEEVRSLRREVAQGNSQRAAAAAAAVTAVAADLPPVRELQRAPAPFTRCASWQHRRMSSIRHTHWLAPAADSP